jgi:hypothetical protein
MTTPKRHQAGAPASQGGKFAPDHKDEAEAVLTPAEEPFRDLGVVGKLVPFDRYDGEIPSGSQIAHSTSGREVVLSIEDDELIARTLSDDGELWTTHSNDNGDATELIAGAISDMVIAEHFSWQAGEESVYEVRSVESLASFDGSLHTDVIVRDEDGTWSEIEYNHATGAITVSRDGDTVHEHEAARVLDATATEFFNGSPWDVALRVHADSLAGDDDIDPSVRAAALVDGYGNPRHFSTAAALSHLAEDARGVVLMNDPGTGEAFALLNAYIDGEGDIVVESRSSGFDEAENVTATELTALIEQAASTRAEAGSPGPTVNYYTEDYTFDRIGLAHVDGQDNLVIAATK